MSKKFKYKIEMFEYPSDLLSEDAVKKIEDFLDGMGGQGWELFELKVTPTVNTTYIWTTWQREL